MRYDLLKDTKLDNVTIISARINNYFNNLQLFDYSPVVVDLPKEANQPYWENREDTLILRIADDWNMGVAFKFGKFAQYILADEFDFTHHRTISGLGYYYLRFWWD